MANKEHEPTDAPIRVTQGTRVEVELVDEAGQAETLAFDLVPDEDADLAAGLLGLGTPLGRAIRGQTAGSTVPYEQGDIRAVRILTVAYSRRNLAATQSAAQRQETLRRAVDRSDLAEAIRFASTVDLKWGGTDPEGIADSWEEGREA